MNQENDSKPGTKDTVAPENCKQGEQKATQSDNNGCRSGRGKGQGGGVGRRDGTGGGKGRGGGGKGGRHTETA